MHSINNSSTSSLQMTQTQMSARQERGDGYGMADSRATRQFSATNSIENARHRSPHGPANDFPQVHSPRVDDTRESDRSKAWPKGGAGPQPHSVRAPAANDDSSNGGGSIADFIKQAMGIVTQALAPIAGFLNSKMGNAGMA